MQLEVFVNGHASNLIGGFSETAKGLASTPSELSELGLLLPEALRERGEVALADIPGLTYRYDRGRQVVEISVGADRLKPHVLDARVGSGNRLVAETGFGGVLNYALVGTVVDDDLRRFRFQGFRDSAALAAHLEGRVFTPHGALETGVIGRTGAVDDGEGVIRLDSAWTAENPDRLMRWRFGDHVNGALPWTRPIRMAGVQVQRSFDLRPDLITAPLPVMSGSAAVPSTVDIYVNNVRSFSQAVPAGPFSVMNLPVVSGAGTARVVVRDSAGRETTSEQAFFASASLLASGLYDYSFEAGVARRNYGVLSSDYSEHPIVSASGRFGVSDRVTLEAHAEGGDGLVNGGVGASVGVGRFAVVSAALSGSVRDGSAGGKVHASLETQLFGWSVSAQSQWTFGDYLDLADITADSDGFAAGYPLITASHLKSLNFVSFGRPLQMLGGNLNLSMIAAEHVDGSEQRIATASYSQRLSDRMSFYATGFHDFQGGATGVFAGLAIGLGGGHHLTVGAMHDDKGTGVSADYVKSSSNTPGSVGWRVSAARGATERTGAQVDWTSSVARVQAGAQSTAGSTYGSVVVTGSVATLGGGVFLANRIDDGFAVVDAGVPGVIVMQENRPIGTTGADGRLLVPGLRANQANKISIDPLSVPLDREVPVVARNVVPARGSGVVVEMKGKPTPYSAIVVLRDARGKPLAPGATGTVTGSGETFVVGYDGEAYLKDVGAHNEVVVTLGEHACTATFSADVKAGVQGRVEGVVCR
ncbi:MAG: fimbria/pilus outer membrane usher protein [Hyphomicrobiaceae bacterium]